MRKQPAITAIAVLSAGLYVAQMSVAQAQTYKADDIVKHFSPATPPAFGATRGLCIGTEADCSKAGHAVKPAAVAAFDLVVRFKYNSEVMFSTEGYASKASAKNAIESMKKNGPEAPIVDTTTEG